MITANRTQTDWVTHPQRAVRGLKLATIQGVRIRERSS